MALSSSERARRHRAHRKDDHSLCDPRTCANATVAPVADATRGEQLFAELAAERVLSPTERALAEEAGRLVDRLDRLHEHLADKSWLKFEVADYSTDTTTVVIVKLDRVLAETRQQQDTLRSLVGELRQSAASAAAKKQAAPRVKGAGLAELIDLASRR